MGGWVASRPSESGERERSWAGVQGRGVGCAGGWMAWNAKIWNEQIAVYFQAHPGMLRWSLRRPPRSPSVLIPVPSNILYITPATPPPHPVANAASYIYNPRPTPSLPVSPSSCYPATSPASETPLIRVPTQVNKSICRLRGPRRPSCAPRRANPLSRWASRASTSSSPVSTPIIVIAPAPNSHRPSTTTPSPTRAFSGVAPDAHADPFAGAPRSPSDAHPASPGGRRSPMTIAERSHPHTHPNTIPLPFPQPSRGHLLTPPPPPPPPAAASAAGSAPQADCAAPCCSPTGTAAQPPTHMRRTASMYHPSEHTQHAPAAVPAARSLDSFNVAFNYGDPILAILWTAVCRVLIGEILRTPATQDPSSPRTYAAVAASASSSSARAPAAQREAIRATLDRVLAAMNRFRETCPLMGMLHDGFVSVQGAM
ncbi:hypothetical protein NUW54_g3366 [Trametes sanguinea]|uniref:Uncharacterized protein n=1 Tax=Trametes sanguinea TaxID=158606 RepID=A0ACC1Q1I4_9APHY|nr:hypothetical protein NUW54_g3366 [Trametes sanguinea]